MPTAPKSIQPQERDLQVIAAVYRYNVLTVDLLKRRFWPKATSKTTYYVRLQKLIDAGYLKSFRVSNPLNNFYGVMWLSHGYRALPELAVILNKPIKELRSVPHSVASSRVAHSTLINEVIMSLEMAVEQLPDVEMEWYSQEYFDSQPLHIPAHPNLPERVLKPDSAFMVQTPQVRFSAFLEADRSSITELRDLRPRFQNYLLYTRTLKVPRPVLWVVPTHNRLKGLEKLALQEARNLKDDPTIFFLTTREQVSEHTLLFEPIWTVVGGPTTKALIDKTQLQQWQPLNPLTK